ncbi:unnamed protein product [Sphagnum jensenii]|uniref:Uncharacterized protein n=2 Tax=Sphagnum jensenii TaxID=128206 RepID=A0ABP0X2Y7_9BRYO
MASQSPLEGAPARAVAETGEGAQLRLPTPDEIRAQDIFNNCAVRTGVSGVMGGGMGVFMGMLFGALDTPLHAETMTARQQFVHAARTMGSRSMHMAKTFAIMGAIFSGTECLIEKARAKHDAVNTATAGCVTGGSMSVRAGPQAACLGCAGFAAFSLLIEKIFDRHE